MKNQSADGYTHFYQPGIVDDGPDPWAFVLVAGMICAAAGLAYAIMEPGWPPGLGTFFSLISLGLTVVVVKMRRRGG